MREVSEISKFEICKQREFYLLSELDICWSKCAISLSLSLSLSLSHKLQMSLFQAHSNFIRFLSLVTPDSHNGRDHTEFTWFAKIFQINGTFSECQNSTESGRPRKEDKLVLQKFISEDIAFRENTQIFSRAEKFAFR
jgi:hypothetical protein